MDTLLAQIFTLAFAVQILRISIIDRNDDIVQLELS